MASDDSRVQIQSALGMSKSFFPDFFLSQSKFSGPRKLTCEIEVV